MRPRDCGSTRIRGAGAIVFFQAEVGIRDLTVTGVQTCALPISWLDGLAWGSGFAAATALLRFVIGIDQMPADTPLIARLVNELSYLAVVGVAIAGLSQLRRTQAQLQQLATHDPLTNVLNARAFSAELAQELGRNRRYGRPLGLIYLDLDDFKKLNDVHGPATGDAVLRLLARAARRAVRPGDVVGRHGGG